MKERLNQVQNRIMDSEIVDDIETRLFHKKQQIDEIKSLVDDIKKNIRWIYFDIKDFIDESRRI